MTWTTGCRPLITVCTRSCVQWLRQQPCASRSLHCTRAGHLLQLWLCLTGYTPVRQTWVEAPGGDSLGIQSTSGLGGICGVDVSV